jgi:hypothetical protein
MPAPNQRRVRLSIDVQPELRRRIKIAAAQRDLSVRDYVEAILRQTLDAEAQGKGVTGRARETEVSARSAAYERDSDEDKATDGPLTRDEQERGLRALAELERLDEELVKERGRRPFAPSRELLDDARDERARELLPDT